MSSGNARAERAGGGSEAREKAEDAADSDVAEGLGRGGLAARGFVYCLVALLGVAIATGGDEGSIDQRGAISSLAARGLGRVLLIPLAAGFAGYAAWRTLRAVTGRREGGSEREGAKGGALRLGDGAKALVYAALCVNTLTTLVEGDDSGSSHGNERTWTARLLESTGGRALLGGGGIAIVAGGAWMARQGWKERFVRRLELGSLHAPWRRVVLVVGRVGYVGRGVVLIAVGGFLAAASLLSDGDEPVGVDETLRRFIAAGDLGRALVLACASGIMAFGLFSFVEARYRKVLDA